MTKNTKKELSIIIVSYNNTDLLIESINSIYKYNDVGESIEVIVVDNSPSDDLFNIIIDKFPMINAIRNENKGFGEGNNVGSNFAKGKYLLFLNPDAMLIQPIFKYAINKFESDPLLGMFGLKLVNKDISPNMSFYLINGGGLLRSLFIKLANYLDFYLDGFMYVSGANMFIRREDFYECGRFDENIFMYYEEPDLTRRLRKIGKKTDYFKDKKIIHLEGGTTLNNELVLRRRLDSAIYYRKKYNQDPDKIFSKELRLSYFKLLLSKLFWSRGSANLKKSINILVEYLNRNK